MNDVPILAEAFLASVGPNSEISQKLGHVVINFALADFMAVRIDQVPQSLVGDLFDAGAATDLFDAHTKLLKLRSSRVAHSFEGGQAISGPDQIKGGVSSGSEQDAKGVEVGHPAN